MSKKILSLILALVLVCGLLAGCGSTGTQSTSGGSEASSGSASSSGTASSSGAASSSGSAASSGTAASSGDAKADGPVEIIASLYSYPSDLEPTNGYYGWALTRIGAGETLVRFDENMDTVGWLADSWENVDKLTWTFHIREGVTFHNGNPVTAKAVMDSIQRSIDKNTRAASISNINSMSADGQTLSIKTKEPYGALLAYMAEPVFTIVDTSVDTSDYANHPIGTGPFMVESFEPGVSIRVVKYANYWDGEPGVDAITFPFLLDSNARALALQSGELDIAQSLDNADLASFTNNDNYIISSKPGTNTIFCYLNVENEFLSDPVVRKAISYAINRELYADKFVGGVEAVGPFSTCLKFGKASLKGYSYDADKAKQMLDDAGYVDTNKNGYREMNGKEISLQLAVVGTTKAATYKSLAEAFQSQLKAIGINIDIIISQIANETDVKDHYDMMFKDVNAGSTNDPQNFLSLYFCTGASNTIGNYSNAEVDALVEELKETFDLDQRAEIGAKAAQIILDDCAYLFLAYPTYNIVTTSRIGGLKHYPVNFYLIDKDICVK